MTSLALPVARVSSLAGLTRRLALTVLTLALAAAALLAPQLAGSASASAPAKPGALIHHGQRYVPKQITTKITRFYAARMLDRLNHERARHGRRPLAMNAKLIESAHGHNLRMAQADEMSHQLPGEMFFADRISATGYKWRSAGENIGWNSDLSLYGIFYLEGEMFHEKAPDNGHRLNILNTSFRQVGIDVYYDRAHGKMWFTQDFGQPA